MIRFAEYFAGSGPEPVEAMIDSVCTEFKIGPTAALAEDPRVVKRLMDYRQVRDVMRLGPDQLTDFGWQFKKQLHSLIGKPLPEDVDNETRQESASMARVRELEAKARAAQEAGAWQL